MTVYTPDTTPVSPNEPQVVIMPYRADGEIYHYDIAYVRMGVEVGGIVRKHRYDDAVLEAQRMAEYRNAPIVYLPNGY